MTRHVVFGVGQVGRHLVDALACRGHDVVAVSRSGRPVPGAVCVAGDARDPAVTATVCRGAAVVYACLNAPTYDRWPDEFPPLQRGVLAGAMAAGARLVVLENLYAYGPTQGRVLSEDLPTNPSSAKAATRAGMTAELLDAHRAGDVEVAVGRASDFFGPGTTASALGDGVFGRALAGRRAQVTGRPDQPHSYSYTPDVATALVTLGSDDRAAGHVWHLPIAETRSTRQIVEHVYRLAGRRPRLLAARRPALRIIGTVDRGTREFLHTLYQFEQPWIVDDGRYRRTFGAEVTPLDDALATTLAWFRDPSLDPTRHTRSQGAPR